MTPENDLPRLPDDRRTRIIEAAIREFAAKGYAGASTNAIAAGAGVAKGLAFHHFGSKEALFVAAFEAVVTRTTHAMFDGLGALPPDLFERFHALGMRKMQLFQQDPDGYRLITVGLAEAPPPVRASMLKLQGELTARFLPTLLGGLDSSRLRPGLTANDAIELVSLVMEGYERRTTPVLAAQPDRGAALLPKISAHARVLLERLRDGLYDNRTPHAAPPGEHPRN